MRSGAAVTVDNTPRPRGTRVDVRVTVDLPGPHLLGILNDGKTYVLLSDLLDHIEETAAAFEKAHANSDLALAFRAFGESIREGARGVSR